MKIYIIIFSIAASVFAVVSILYALVSSSKPPKYSRTERANASLPRKKNAKLGLLAGCALGVLSVVLLGCAVSRCPKRSKYSRRFLRSRRSGLLALDLSLLGRYR